MSTAEGKRNSHSQIPSRGKEGTWIPACQDTGGCPEPRSTFPPRYQLFSLTELVMNMVFLRGNNEILDVTSRTNQMCPHRPGKGRPFLSKWCPEVEQNSYIWLFCFPLEEQCVVIKKKTPWGSPRGPVAKTTSSQYRKPCLVRKLDPTCCNKRFHMSKLRPSECVLRRFSCVQFFVTLWTAARQASLFTGLSRQEYPLQPHK